MKEIYSKPVSKIEEFSAVEVLTASGIGIELGNGDDDVA